ncbi:hypothetical protein PINS_up011147 [Pythium insidiosum]|nr:hypothetical protein PINS_up011147 [Pythium insidiosum]
MAISRRVQLELAQATPGRRLSVRIRRAGRWWRPEEDAGKISPVKLSKAQRDAVATKNKGKAWTVAEHQRFLEALDFFPSGPWRAIADYVGTKTARQAMTHAQKCREKFDRRQRGLRSRERKKPVEHFVPPTVLIATTSTMTTTSSQQQQTELPDCDKDKEVDPPSVEDVDLAWGADTIAFADGETLAILEQIVFSSSNDDAASAAVQLAPIARSTSCSGELH